MTEMSSVCTIIHHKQPLIVALIIPTRLVGAHLLV
jgi:hypothetical protein